MESPYSLGDRRHALDLTALPDYMASDIFDVNFAELSAQGRVHVLTDLDLTLISAGGNAIEPAIIDYLAAQQQAGTIESISVASNAKRDIGHFAEQLGARLFQPFFLADEQIKKPDERFFDHILTELGQSATTAVMIGDRYSDIIGANKLGIATVKVSPYGSDYWFDRLLLTRWRDGAAYRRTIRALGQQSGR